MGVTHGQAVSLLIFFLAMLALGGLIGFGKAYFETNFPQVLMAIGICALGATGIGWIMQIAKWARNKKDGRSPSRDQ